MLINQAKRIYMNAEDASPGGGAVPTDPPAPADQTAPEPKYVTIEQMNASLEEKLTAFQNGFFANARKAGLLKKDEPAPAQTPAPQPAAAPASTGLTAVDVQRMLDRNTALTRAEVEHKLNAAQIKRMRTMLEAEKPEDAAEWVNSFVADMGIVKAAPQPTTPATVTTQPATTPAKPNVSDRGTAAPTDLRDSEGVLNSRPLEMTGHDVDALILKHGQTKGLQMFQERVLAALRNVRIRPSGR